MTTLFVFDIDLTLIHSGGAGSRAMDRTFQGLYGIGKAFEGIEFAGRTDGAILRDCYVHHSLHERDLVAEFGLFRDAYFDELARELQVSDCRVLPGIPDLLNALAMRADTIVGLGTGNYRVAAELKLNHVGIWDRFRDGGFADDSEDRAEVIACAIRRLADTGDAIPDRVWVVGDSPHDVSAGKANRALVVGVGTGHCSTQDLLAAGADVVFDDLGDTAAFLSTTLS